VQKFQRPVSGHSTLVRHREGLLAVTASIGLLAGLATSAAALPFNLQPRVAPPPAAVPQDFTRPAQRALRPNVSNASRDKSAAKEKEGEQDLGSRAKGLLTVIVSIDKQQLTLYSDGHPIAHSRVSTGTPSHPTPTGVFSVIQKDRWHRSNLYDDAPMFYMQRITWSGVAMHQGIVPNHAASHGCIRLPEAFAKQLWGVTRLGVRVIIARGEVTPVPIAHARLFTFKREPLAPTIDNKIDVKLDSKDEPGISSAERVRAAYGVLEVAQLAGKKGEVAARNGMASDASRLGDPALDAIAYAIKNPRETPATSSEVVRSAYDTFEAPKVRRARSVVTNSVAEIKPLKPGPISVFISRKEGKLFVRKGFDPVFSTPVTFENPEKPLGTHVYTALAIKDDNTTMRWNVMSMPGGGSAKKSEKGVREYVGPASNANEALDRVTIPQDALDRISELMSPSASLIISDQGLGPETGTGTDFIVLTR
jgi:lipoprotein-anchoring transpeptidase ErfK/SrfK